MTAHTRDGKATTLTTMAKHVLGRHPHHPDDTGVSQLVARLPTPVTSALTSQLDRANSARLASYGLRMAVLAMREQSLERLHEGLLAIAVGAAVHTSDDRDLMVILAVPHVAATHLGAAPTDVFNATADRFEPGWLTELLRTFGARHDVTLAAFGWRQVTTPTGADLISWSPTRTPQKHKP
jgi:hypothetical protein